MIHHIEEHNIPKELYELPVVIYGGANSGRDIHRLLSRAGVNISHVIDDNENIQGQILNGTEIISFARFMELYSNRGEVAVILATVFGMPVLKKLEPLPYVQVYEMYEWLEKVCGSKQLVEDRLKDIAAVERFYVDTLQLDSQWADDESRRVMAGVRRYVQTRDANDIISVSTEYDHYFIPEVIEAVSRLQGGLKIIDGGAYQGELLQSIKNLNLPLEKWYCFEADQENFKKLVYYRDLNHMQEKQICIDKGLWSSSGSLYFEGGQETVSKIIDHETDEKIDVISIDDYFRETTCNFIKMDIEGAEYNALNGGIHTIERDRPILAISIYHSLDDFWRIPQYLMGRLKAYRYYVRHHQTVFSDTILYAIPDRS